MTTTAARAEAASAENFKPWTRPEMAARLARDIPEGWCVNLGIGIPLLVSNFVKGREVIFQSENGIIGMGGIQYWQDAAEFLLAGASALAVGTALFVDPGVLVKIQDGLANYLTKLGATSLKDIVGTLRMPGDAPTTPYP